MKSGWFAALVLTASLAGAADNPSIVPLDEVQPGMKGYGVTVFEGMAREKFTFFVRSVVPGTHGGTTRIIVGLTGCPDCSEGGQHMFEHTQIYGGMSGSPMYVVGADGSERILGGLVAAKDFATTAKTLVTPVEFQLGMSAKLPARERPARSPAEPGDYSATCLVYGDAPDSDWCYYGTITTRHDGRLYSMAHAVPWNEKSMFPYAEMSLPVFLVPVADILQSQESPSKMAGSRGAPIGSAVLHGPFGFVVDEGPLPDTVPVTLTISGVTPQPVTLPPYHMAYHKHAPAALQDLLVSLLNRLPGDAEGSRTEVTIRLSKPEGTIRFTDSWATAYPSITRLLTSLIEQEKKDLRIAGVEIGYAPVEKMDYWSPVRFTITGNGANAMLTVLARRSRDNQTSEMSERVDLREAERYRKRKLLVWTTRKERKLIVWDGATLQNYILDRIPVRAALPLLDRIQDRESLYVVYGESSDEMSAHGGMAVGGWHERLADIRIVLKPAFGGAHFFIPASSDGMAHAVEFPLR